MQHKTHARPRVGTGTCYPIFPQSVRPSAASPGAVAALVAALIAATLTTLTAATLATLIATTLAALAVATLAALTAARAAALRATAIAVPAPGRIAGAAAVIIASAATAIAFATLVGGLCALARIGVLRGVVCLHLTHEVCQSRRRHLPEVLLSGRGTADQQRQQCGASK
jgi:hypothetical protein